jgi:hypothetical protein
MKRTKLPELPAIVDEPGMAERFQRGLQNLLNTPHRPHDKPAPKRKERPASKGRVHKGKKGDR